MISDDCNAVTSAFETLVNKLEQHITGLNEQGIKAFSGRDYSAISLIAGKAQRLSGFEGRLCALRKEWDELLSDDGPPTADCEPAGEADVSASAGQPQREQPKPPAWKLSTPEGEFYRPILDALATMGGTAKKADVLERVGEGMKVALKKSDHEPIPGGDPNVPLWKITCEWARRSLMQDGLLKVDRKDVWEITERGRAAVGDLVTPIALPSQQAAVC